MDLSPENLSVCPTAIEIKTSGFQPDSIEILEQSPEFSFFEGWKTNEVFPHATGRRTLPFSVFTSILHHGRVAQVEGHRKVTPGLGDAFLIPAAVRHKSDAPGVEGSCRTDALLDGLDSGNNHHMDIYNGCTDDRPESVNNHNLPPTWSPQQIHRLVALFDQAEAAAADAELLKRVRRARLPLMFKQISGEYLNFAAGQQPDPQLTHRRLGELVDRFVELARQEGATLLCEFDDDDTGTLDVWLAGFKKWYDVQAK